MAKDTINTFRIKLVTKCGIQIFLFFIMIKLFL